VSADANARLGKGDFLVAEADESDASFLYLQPVLAVITNIDADHMETYGHNFAQLKRAFVDFAQRLPFYGTAVLCIDDPNVRAIEPLIAKSIITYGLAADARLRATDVENVDGRMRFVARDAKRPDLTVDLNMPGVHNVQNALARDCGGTRGRRRRCRDRESSVRVPRRGAALPALRRRRSDTRHVHADRRLRSSSRQRWPQRSLRPVRASPGAARARVPAASLHANARSVRRLRECALDGRRGGIGRRLSRRRAAARRRGWAGLARAVRVAGKVEPVFVEKIGEMAAAIRAIARDGDVVVTMGAGSIGQVPALLVSEPQ
jgi:UDP-N-acetylmuramate--alanine ligase